MPSKIYKDIAIPPILTKYDDFRYILIKKDKTRKVPTENEWQSVNNYANDATKLKWWLRGGGNYGIATGFGNLVVFDVDDVNRMESHGILKKLQKTLTIRTGGGGLHFYYICEGGKKTTVYDPEEKDENGNFVHLGEIQAKGEYVVGPGSVHKTGNRYEIVNNADIAEIKWEELTEAISGLRTKQKENKPRKTITHEHTNDVNIELITTPLHYKQRMGKSGRELIGEHPLHGATKREDRGTSSNFSLNTSNGTWHCFACKSGGGWMELMAVMEGMIRCDQAGPGCLTSRQRKDIIEIAESRGIIKAHIPEETKDLVIVEDREIVNELPKKLPNNKVIVIRKPPRIGGTHWAIQTMKRANEGTYLTHRHSIVEHAARVAEEIGMKSVVWLVGIRQPGACRKTQIDCENCPLKPSQEEYLTQQKVAIKLLREAGVLTTKSVPGDMCPYYTMKMAEPYARYCLTVSNNIDVIRERKFVILDEDPTLQHFYPPSVEIATIRKTRGDKRVKNELVALDDELDSIIKEGKRKKLKPYAIIIAKIRDCIEAHGISGADQTIEEIEKILQDFEPTDVKVREEGEKNGDISLEAMVRCLSKLYGPCPVTKQPDGKGGEKITILGDERTPVFSMKWMENAEKVVIIGATKAEMFAREYNGKVIEINEFGYKDRYTVLLISDNGKGAANAEKKNILKIANTIWKDAETTNRMPFMVLTGSQQSQLSAVGAIPGAIGVKSEKEVGLQWGFNSGEPIVFYQNSIISRGLDVDQFNLLLIYDCNFAQPFWSVVDETTRDSIIRDETTNSALRISPTKRRDDNMMKIIVMRERDWWKVQYLEGREKVITADPITIGKILRTMRIGGNVEITDDGVKITKKGITTSNGEERLNAMMSDVSDMVDDADMTIAMTRIEKLMRAAKKTASKSRSTSDIIDEIQKVWIIRKGVITRALQELYRKGTLRIIKTNKNGKPVWEI
jgi:hypothetical protein